MTARAATSGINVFDEGTPSRNVRNFFVQFSSSQLIGKQVLIGFTNMQDVDQ